MAKYFIDVVQESPRTKLGIPVKTKKILAEISKSVFLKFSKKYFMCKKVILHRYIYLMIIQINFPHRTVILFLFFCIAIFSGEFVEIINI